MGNLIFVIVIFVIIFNSVKKAKGGSSKTARTAERDAERDSWNRRFAKAPHRRPERAERKKRSQPKGPLLRPPKRLRPDRIRSFPRRNICGRKHWKTPGSTRPKRSRKICASIMKPAERCRAETSELGSRAPGYESGSLRLLRRGKPDSRTVEPEKLYLLFLQRGSVKGKPSLYGDGFREISGLIHVQTRPRET